VAGPLDIQRVPKGLIDLLGMKATGDTPHILDTATRASLDVLNYYLIDRKVNLQGQTGVAVNALGFLITSSNPQGPQPGEIWLVHSAAMAFPALAAATTLKGFMAIKRTGILGAACYQFLGPEVNLPALTGGGSGETYQLPWIMLPGEVFGFYCTAITGVPASTPQFWLQYAVLNV
jgi:hypothetical protein